MERILEICITDEQSGKVLRDILRRDLGISAKLLARIKRREGGICLNGNPVFVNASVKQGDILRVVIEESGNNCGNLIPTPGELDIRYEDSDVVIINKPAGIPVQPAIGKPSGSLGNIFVWHYAQYGENVIYRPVNRLDSGTSGLMAVAKNSHTHSTLIEKLHTGEFRRIYHAIVHGEFAEKSGSVQAPICRREGSVLERCVHPDGKWAKTNYTVIKTFSGCSLLELELESGRTHQIRVHMAHIGHPLVGDFLYGTEDEKLMERCALHSARIEFIHPISKERICIDCDMPQDMRDFAEEK